MTWRTTHETRMNKTRKSHPRDMSATSIYPFKIPNCFSCKRIMLIQESTSIFLMEDPSEAPWLLFKRLNIKNFNHEHVSGMCSFDLNRSREIMYATLHLSFLNSGEMIP